MPVFINTDVPQTFSTVNLVAHLNYMFIEFFSQSQLQEFVMNE